MAETKNTFLKGKMNKDLDSRIVPNGEYREARNLSISRSEGSRVGEFENVLGNTSISSLTSIGASATTEIIGKFIDENSNTAYFFATDHDNSDPTVRATAADNCYIVKVNLNVDVVTVPVILVQGFFLNFNISFPITGVNLIEDLLFFTDNLNQPRKINVTKTLGHYTKESQISVAKYAPYEPILVMERIGATVNGAITNSATLVVADSSLIKVGDILTKKNKVNTTSIPGLVTVISNDIVTNTLTLSNSVTLADATAIDFTRPSMTNKKDFEMSNHSSGAVKIVNPGTLGATYTINSPGIGNNFPNGTFIYGGKNGIPRIGDLVSGNGITADTRVASVSVINQYKNPSSTSAPENFQTYQLITVTLNKATSMVDDDLISISDNPDYDAAWNGDEKILEDKFVRFSYRFKFEDNEYSLIAPFTQPMFIPKQYGEFGGGAFSDKEDMDNAYTSTIVNWFENNINNILLKIPMSQSTPALVISNQKISEVDILYKESDALAVKVLETIKLNSQTFSSISFQDATHSSATENPVGSGNYDINPINKHFLDYDYSSIKPYKTLPNNQITRVSDKVPVKALAQEVIGNRVVYGNYLDRHTSPVSIDYSAYATNKSTDFDNYTQFPKHQLKQDRTYQVGFILSDYYGRQSDVVLSSRDGTNQLGSTVFNPYNDLTIQQQSPILNWLGNALNVTLYTAITGAGPDGSPGIYNEITNPLGWYSYKIVVKQLQQEYYNVYLPGFVNGYPVIQSLQNERNTSFFSTLQSDNVNKVPRDLNEVGPNDREFTTSENLIIRVNNPTIDNKQSTTADGVIVNPYVKDRAWNAQYYPGNKQQEVLQISTIRDMEVQAIPFKANALKGEYGESNIAQAYNYFTPGVVASGIESVNETPEPTGAIPWGTTGPLPSFYNADSNPFVFKGDQSQNKNNPIGAYVTGNSVNENSPVKAVLSMVPFLSVAETRPVESLLDIYWETSLSGNLVNLNSLVNTQSDGITGSNFEATSFPESVEIGDLIGFGFNFLNGAGQFIPASQITLNSITIKDGNDTALSSSLFSITKNVQQTAFEIKATTPGYFYSASIFAAPLTGVFTITANVTFNSENPIDIALAPLTLTNIAPLIDNFTQPTGVTTASGQSIITLTGTNGSANAAVNTTELNWSIVSVSPTNMASKFAIGSTNGELTTVGVLDDNLPYNIIVKATDVSGSGLDSPTASVQFQVGSAVTNRVNIALCQGWQGSSFTGCGESLGVIFDNSQFTNLAVPTSSVTVFNSGSSGTSFTYPPNNAANSYNVFARNPTTPGDFGQPNRTHTTGALVQGTLYITPTLTNVGGTGTDDDVITFTIQVDTGSGFVQAVTSSSATPASETITNITLQVGNNATASSKKIFDTPGEYRILTTSITGGMCSLSQTGTSFRVNFGDNNHIGQSCFPAPD